MGFCEFQAVKFSQSREIHRCTRKRQGCTRNRHTSGRGSPPDRSIRLCACGTLRTADWYNECLNLCGGERSDPTVFILHPTRPSFRPTICIQKNSSCFLALLLYFVLVASLHLSCFLLPFPSHKTGKRLFYTAGYWFHRRILETVSKPSTRETSGNEADLSHHMFAVILSLKKAEVPKDGWKK